MSRQVIPHKAGATFSYAGTVTLPSGTWSATCKACTESRTGALTLVSALTVTLTPPVSPATYHTILVEAAGNVTASWPLEKLVCDVLFTDASATPVKVPSPTFVIDVTGSPSNV